MTKHRLGLYEKAMPNNLTLEDKLLLTKECGFDYLEISIDENDDKISRLDMGIEDIIKLKTLMAKNEIYFETMCLSAHRKYPLGSENNEIREKGLQIMKKAIIFSRNMGIRIIQLAGYDVYYESSNEQTKLNFLENLKLCVELASEYGVILAFETMETEFMNTVVKAKHYVELINSPYLQIYPDIGNIRNATENYLEDIREGKGKIVAVHLKETQASIYRNMEYGNGRVDFIGNIEELIDLGIRRFTCEFWYDDKTEPKEYITRNLRYIKELFAR